MDRLPFLCVKFPSYYGRCVLFFPVSCRYPEMGHIESLPENKKPRLSQRMGSMSYTTEKLPNEPIVFAKLHTDFNIVEEGEPLNSDALALIEAQAEPVYYIADISDYPPSLDDVVSAVNWGGKGKAPTLNHPNVCEAIIVSRSAMVKLAVKGLRSASWGNMKVQCFETLEEALAYARR